MQSDLKADDEDDDPVRPIRAPIELLTEAAADAGLIQPGDRVDQNLVELCMRAVDKAATIADQLRVPDGTGRHRQRRDPRAPL